MLKKLLLLFHTIRPLKFTVAVSDKKGILRSIYSSEIVLESYPVSLRSINVMRFLSRENFHNPEILEKTPYQRTHQKTFIERYKRSAISKETGLSILKYLK